jgi:hypothetical protein
MDDEEVVMRLMADYSLLRLPLVRNGNQVTTRMAEPSWKAWLAPPAPGGDRP